ncbi:sugar kinase [Propionibacterium australiense]|uniref:Carbohydrate kinase PfkB n=1 Tax=Propionibacterium australiense TaxID=119981 RepID=A0A383S503_9ACTN|nr:sugar kinase [Propionibacterium australiense]RLP08895.1 sugar kinase [Propionibacterium australiense]RLP11729.1 sugar kinase [Propionibacterium australiense]SYZ32474.1 Carbohydrate kinase PfkB [Propionibacterium australiense]VEH90139.1 aminoimidazole riboside kinase [Propionibacterium australiense]
MQLRKDAQWSLVTPTSMGVRISPASGQPVQAADQFALHVTSAETNVGSIPSHLGEPVKVLTNFVAGSPIAQLIKANLASRHMAYEGPDVPQGGAWGYRHQFNIADSGYGNRGARVWNDRAGEVGRILDAKDFDLDRIFGSEGVKIVHMSGLIASLSPQTCQFCLEVARTAKKYGTAVSFDLNYRASFWEGREAELRAAFTEIAEQCTVLVGNEEDFQLALGLQGPEAGGKGLAGKIDAFKGMIEQAHERFSGVEYFTTTLREVVNTNEHMWGAILWNDGTFHVAEPRPIGVLDRIGGGDATVGGILHGLLRDWDAEKCMQFGWASGALATTFLTDYAIPADEDQIWAIWNGNARIKR